MASRDLARRFPVLTIRDFRLLLADRVLAPMSYAFSLVGVAFAVLDATRTPAHPNGSTADLSYVLAAQIAPSLIFTLLGGVFADRFRPQRVIVAANLMIACGEGTFGILVLTGHPGVPVMIGLEFLTGSGMAVFYPASTALLPMLVPAGRMRQASALSRLVMNSAMMAGAALAGECVAAFGPGWAMTACGAGMLGTVPLMLAISVDRAERPPEHAPSMIRELRDGWSEFRSHTWLWATVLQFAVVMAAWYGGVQVLGPVVAKAHLGGAAAWGMISACEAVGMIAGGLIALRVVPRRPVLTVVVIGAAISAAPLSFALLLPLPVICAVAFGLGVGVEILSVVWAVTMAARIPGEKLARVSAYDALGSIMGMPAGAVVAGPVASVIGVRATQYAAVALTLIASGLALIPADVRRGEQAPADPDPEAVEVVLT